MVHEPIRGIFFVCAADASSPDGFSNRLNFANGPEIPEKLRISGEFF
jgi:hypothetical protein